MAQVEIGNNIYCQQGDNKVELVYINSPLATIQVSGMLSEQELFKLGNSILKTMKTIPAAKKLIRTYTNTQSNRLYTIDTCGEIWDQNKKYEMVIIIQWNDKTNMAKEVNRKVYYFDSFPADIKAYFSSDEKTEAFFHTYPQYTKMTVKKGYLTRAE